MALDTLSIPSIREVIYNTYANFPTSGLTVGDLAWATDRKCLYRWSGSAWEAIGISSRHGDYADIGDPADYPESSLYQADDQQLLYMVVSGAWEKTQLTPAEAVIVASDTLRNSNDTERTNAAQTWTKIKEIKVNETFDGEMRIKYDTNDDTASNVQSNIYKNGSPIGTERNNSSGSYQTYSEDLELSLVANDLLQIYTQAGSAGDIYVRNFRLYYGTKLSKLGAYDLESELFAEMTAISTTNQDP